jgi:hypothetical protein
MAHARPDVDYRADIDTGVPQRQQPMTHRWRPYLVQQSAPAVITGDAVSNSNAGAG